MPYKNRSTGRPKGSRGCAISDEEAREMHRQYMAGISLAAIARKHGRGLGGNIRDLFVRRGMKLKPMNPRLDPKTGCFKAAPRLTWPQIKALLDAHTRFSIPEPMLRDWRHMTMKERGRVIAYLRERIPDRFPMPRGGYSSNVKPFDYTSQEAWDIVNELNKGLNSREWVISMKPCSQGLIWDGRLWFWSGKTGAYSASMGWTKEHGRPLLNRVIWETANNKRVPPGYVVRHHDGNQNNLDPGNLYLATRNQVCRENHGAAHLRRSRETIEILLKRNQQQATHENKTIRQLQARQTARRRKSAA